MPSPSSDETARATLVMHIKPADSQSKLPFTTDPIELFLELRKLTDKSVWLAFKNGDAVAARLRTLEISAVSHPISTHEQLPCTTINDAASSKRALLHGSEPHTCIFWGHTICTSATTHLLCKSILTMTRKQWPQVKMPRQKTPQTGMKDSLTTNTHVDRVGNMLTTAPIPASLFKRHYQLVIDTDFTNLAHKMGPKSVALAIRAETLPEFKMSKYAEQALPNSQFPAGTPDAYSCHTEKELARDLGNGGRAAHRQAMRPAHDGQWQPRAARARQRTFGGAALQLHRMGSEWSCETKLAQCTVGKPLPLLDITAD